MAEFLQISPDRWLSVQKHSGSKYTIAISGAFPSNPPTPCFEVTLYKRWYALGRDTGWRQVDCPVKFDYHPATDDTGVSTWSGELNTPGSPYWVKYRVLLTEQEFPGDSRRHSFSAFINLP
jgi:hypothetical protein